MGGKLISKSLQGQRSTSGPYMQTLPGSFSLLSLPSQDRLLFGMQCLQPLDLSSRLSALHQDLRAYVCCQQVKGFEVHEALKNLT